MEAYLSLGTAMLVVIAVWAAIIFTATSVGAVFYRCLTAGQDLDWRSLFLCFWVGWSLLLLFLQIWQLWLPVNRGAGLLWLGAGIASFLGNRRRFVALLRGVPARWMLLALAGCALLAAWIANRGMAPVDLGDTGLYHLASVRWNVEYAIVPGLGNLHGRLAYNSAYFLYAGLFESLGWKGGAYHFSNGLLLLVLAMGILGSFTRSAFDPKEADRADLFNAVLIVFLPNLLFTYASNLSNDLAVFALGSVLGQFLCKLIFVPGSRAERNWQMGAILLVASAGLSLKLSFLALGSASALVGLSYYWKERRQTGPAWGIKASWAWLIAPLAIGIWMLRGVILSGYPAYPSTLAGLSVVWRVPPGQVQAEARAILSWGRAPHQDPEQTLAGWNWLLPKLKKGLSRFPEFILPLSVAAAGMLAYLARLLTGAGAGSREPRLRSILFLAPAVVALAFWFFSSPNIRFVGVSFWWLAAGALVILKPGRRSIRLAMLACSLFGVLFLLEGSLSRGFWIHPSSANGFYPAPIAETAPFATRSGLILNVPLKGDQCWGAALPCTPYPQAELRLIEPGSLQSGFTVSP